MTHSKPANAGATDSHDAWLSSIKAKCLRGLHDGVAKGLWEGVCEKSMLPIREVNTSDFHSHATMAHAWVKLGKFKSMKEAKRAGWGKPLEVGRFRIGTWILEVVGDNAQQV